MAEVSRRLGAGACRLSVYKPAPNRVFPGQDGHVHAVISSAVELPRTREGKNKDDICQELCKRRLTTTGDHQSSYKPQQTQEHIQNHLLQLDFTEKNDKHYYGPQSKVSSFPLLSSVPCCDFFIAETDLQHSMASAVFQRSSGPLHGAPNQSQVKITVCRMSCWKSQKDLMTSRLTRMRKSFNQTRAYISLMVLNDRQAILSISPRKPQAELLSSTRAYCWKANRDKSSPPIYRSRTAYYDILQVSPNATQAQIKTAYYKQSFIYHPDKNAGSEEAKSRFAEISEAYSVLGSIALRRKYDRGILSNSDVQSAGRPSTKETPASRSTGPQQHQHQQQQRSRRFSNVGGKPMFDFDAFYRAHYGEQLQREQEMRMRREKYRMKKQEDFKKWKIGKMLEMTVGALLAVGGYVLFSLRS